MRRTSIIIGILPALAVLAGCLGPHSPGSGPYSSGLAYLQAQQQVDPAPIEARLNEQSIQKEKLAQVKNGTLDPFTLFKDSVILGDSRVYGFDSYQFLPENQVFAAAGNTIKNIQDHADQIGKIKPKTIYLSYGVNDMGLKIGAESGTDGYRAEYEKQIQTLLAKSPNSVIAVNSIVPVTPEALEKSPRWDQAEDYNRQIAQMCADNGWYYIDNTSLADGGQAQIYQPDGIHFLTDFYPVWARNMVLTRFS